MIKRIHELATLPNLQLKVSFDDGRTVLYDVRDDVQVIPDFAPLETTPGPFDQVQLDESRTCVYWNDRIDLPSDAIYEYGQEIS